MLATENSAKKITNSRESSFLKFPEKIELSEDESVGKQQRVIDWKYENPIKGRCGF